LKQPAAEARLAAKEVGGAGEIEPKSVSARHAGRWRPVGNGMASQAFEPGAIGIRISIAHLKVAHHCAGVRGGHAGTQPKL
jgi:hypothetical protein